MVLGMEAAATYIQLHRILRVASMSASNSPNLVEINEKMKTERLDKMGA